MPMIANTAPQIASHNVPGTATAFSTSSLPKKPNSGGTPAWSEEHRQCHQDTGVPRRALVEALVVVDLFGFETRARQQQNDHARTQRRRSANS